METQVALISRFCAIEGTFCERLVRYQGTNSFFFAYPSGEHWEDFSRLLVSELEFQDVYGTRWQDVTNNDVLFLKSLRFDPRTRLPFCRSDSTQRECFARGRLCVGCWKANYSAEGQTSARME